MTPTNNLPFQSDPDPRPTITERDISFHQAQAGIAAREAAAASGGDPAQLRALVGAAAVGGTITSGKAHTLLGHELRRDDLLVSLCFALYAQVFGQDPRSRLGGEDSAIKLAAIGELALIFTQAETAWDLLDHAADTNLGPDDRAGWARDFRRAAVEFAGRMTAADIRAFHQHLDSLHRSRPVGDAAEDDAGNA